MVPGAVCERPNHFIRRDGDVDTVTEIAVASDDAAEVRRVILTNRSLQPKEIELTSYSEVVLAPPDDDRAHPAFGNLFVQTEFLPAKAAILATRRPRSQPRLRSGAHTSSRTARK
jgi:hypothetical protein